jgi:hypothetical protein
MEIKKVPPGVANGAHLQRWQFDHESVDEEPAHPRRAARMAHGELSQIEEAVLNTVLHHPGLVSRRELEAIMAERLGMSHGQVYQAAQRLAENGNICRRKVGRIWHYWRSGLPAPATRRLSRSVKPG